MNLWFHVFTLQQNPIMIKTRKRLLFAFVSFTLAITSCKKENSNPILGTWSDYYNESMTFYGNGRGKLEVSSGPSSFSWHESGSSLEIDYDNGYYEVWTVRISGSEMNFYDDNGNVISWDKR